MEILYVAMRAMSCREMMALKATEDPMLIRESRQVIVQVARTAFRGAVEFFVWAMLERNLPKGRPPSRAKAKTCRALEALESMEPTSKHVSFP